MSWLWYILLALGVAMLIGTLYYYAFKFEIKNFKLSQIDISVKNKVTGTGACNKDDNSMVRQPVLKILHLSDFHLRKNNKGKQLFDFVKSLEHMKTDFLFITGDLIDGNENIGYMVKMLASFKAKYGKFAVFGVHDHYDKAVSEFIRNSFKGKKSYKKQNDTALLANELAGIGIEVINNQSRIFGSGSSDCKEGGRESLPGFSVVEIIGLDDPVIEKINIGEAFSGISYEEDINFMKVINKQENHNKSKLSKVRPSQQLFVLSKEENHVLSQEGRLRIALIHTPDRSALAELCRKGTDIVICGHTHGGQVRLPLIGALISGCKIKTKFASGLFYFKKMVLYVSRGLGEGRYSQFRFYCQPEATVINIFRE